MAEGEVINPTPEAAAAAEASKQAIKAARKKSRKELRSLHGREQILDPAGRLASGGRPARVDNPDFDHKRYHALHYLAAGRPVPDTDPDDLD
jgi:hypothetical protein